MKYKKVISIILNLSIFMSLLFINCFSVVYADNHDKYHERNRKGKKK